MFSITARRTKGTGFLDRVVLDDFHPESFRGKNILLVEDIIDRGFTLAAVLERLDDVAGDRRVCVLVDKREDRKKSIRLDHVGFRISEGWVIGVGMDVEEQGRDLPFIGIIDAPADSGRAGF